MERITKRDFCKRCGISMPTCYKWIEKDKDGLAAFVHEDGIDPALFDLAPWNKYESIETKKDTAAAQRIEALERELEQAKQTIQQQGDLLNLLSNQLAQKDTQINQLHSIVYRQTQALPPPRRSFFEWLGIKKKDTNAQPQQPME